MTLKSKIAKGWRLRGTFPYLLKRNFVQCSQYAEDAIFECLLKPSRKGTYVDVGANKPVEGSNTFNLYLKGWSGLTIDPNPLFAQQFRKHRPRDTHVTAGVALDAANLTYHMFETDLLNTFSTERADFLKSLGNVETAQHVVQCRRLDDLVDEYCPGKQIDLLNIDCEGFDLEVLKSLDLSKRRPTSLIVEDYDRYRAFAGLGDNRSELAEYLRETGYTPIAQSAWSAIYVAQDWRTLFARSEAFSEKNANNGYLPGE